MSSKTVSFRQPPPAPDPESEAWVAERRTEAPRAPTPAAKPGPVRARRMTVELPEALHRDFKVECARRGRQAYEVVREILERAVGEMKKERL
jgi:hypothetical protein